MSKVLITRTRKQSQNFADELKIAGFEPVFFPTIEIRPVDKLGELTIALENIDIYDWVLFTSSNAVDVFLEKFPASIISSVKVAAIGGKTGTRLEAAGVNINLVPDDFVGEGLLESLGDVNGKRFLLPRAKVARKILPQEIRKAGGSLDEFAIYETVVAEPTKEEYAALENGVDVVTFTSPSTVNNFRKLTKEAGLDPMKLKGEPLFACIGPVTEKAAHDAGFTPIVMAETYTTDGLIEMLKILFLNGTEKLESA